MNEALVEAVARAFAIAEGLNPDADPNYVSERVSSDFAFPPEARLWWRYRKHANQAIYVIYRGLLDEFMRTRP